MRLPSLRERSRGSPWLSHFLDRPNRGSFFSLGMTSAQGEREMKERVIVPRRTLIAVLVFMRASEWERDRSLSEVGFGEFGWKFTTVGSRSESKILTFGGDNVESLEKYELRIVEVGFLRHWSNFFYFFLFQLLKNRQQKKTLYFMFKVFFSIFDQIGKQKLILSSTQC